MNQFEWLFGSLEDGLYCDMSGELFRGLSYVQFGMYIEKKTLDCKLRDLLEKI